MIQFLASLDLEENLKELFKDFVGQKNLLFFDIKSFYLNINELTIHIINFVDICEHFIEANLIVKEKDAMVDLKMAEVKKYYYLLGFLSNLNDIYQAVKEKE